MLKRYEVGRHVKDTDGRPLFSYLRECPDHAGPSPHHTRAVELEGGRQAEIEVCWTCGRIQKVSVL